MAFRNAAEIVRTSRDAPLFGDTGDGYVSAALRAEARRFVVETLEQWAAFVEKVR